MPLLAEGIGTLAHAEHSAAASPVSWLLVLGVTGAFIGTYRFGVVRRRRRLRRPWAGWRTACFMLGAALVAASLSPIVEEFGHASMSGHMVQHLLLGMFAPVLLVLGAPLTVALGALPVACRRPVRAVLTHRAVHFVAHPVSTASLHVGGVYALYLSPLYLLSTEHPVVHHLVHAHFLIAGYLFVWSIAGPDPAPRRAGFPMRLAVLVLAAAAHAYLAKLLYARAGELPPGVGVAVTEAEGAAQVMYYGGDIAELALAVMLFASWYAGRQRMGATSRPARHRPTDRVPDAAAQP
ncbi:cytochrome c oxidase assembly protein [Phytoactinopolyspora alkaliphila]|uniref:Cytochrome c oxidase assembly protein n=1 Tax=Phytoactinopolyspora alkaliphila TaxID=1783498 RepID=A0A6N9YNM8_9ACTN|nr:cytochrome c oxidase assembly protein [Phytoactinopolyspora alkaliphila]NED96545.1 cytochrome c oxidase assembly protein [Phytoactinopolyspora alkaliphila]